MITIIVIIIAPSLSQCNAQVSWACGNQNLLKSGASRRFQVAAPSDDDDDDVEWRQRTQSSLLFTYQHARDDELQQLLAATTLLLRRAAGRLLSVCMMQCDSMHAARIGSQLEIHALQSRRVACTTFYLAGSFVAFVLQ